MLIPYRVYLVDGTDDTFFFFFNDTATTEIYTLSLHDALPIYLETCFREGQRSGTREHGRRPAVPSAHRIRPLPPLTASYRLRSEEHTSELQSQSNLVCRLLLEKKKK